MRDHSGSPALEMCVEPAQRGSHSLPSSRRSQHADSGSPHLRLTLRAGRVCVSVDSLPHSASQAAPLSRKTTLPQAPAGGPSAQPSWRWVPRLPFRCNVAIDSGTQKRGFHVSREGSVSSHLPDFPHLWAR